MAVAGMGIAVAPGTHLAQDRDELRFPQDSVVVLAGIPGAGKTTLLRRLFPVGGDHQGVQVFDSERLRAQWMPVLGVVPYAAWRPLLHLAYYVKALSAMRTGPMLLHDCATRPWVRRLIGWRAKRSGLQVHLVLLDVPGDVARSGQWARGRVVRSGSMETHCRRWPELLEQAVVDPSQVVPGAVSAVVLSRRQASQLERIRFDSAG
ncbi:AAA family ATPase [Kribbella sp. CA-247076]|uniref:AAA family ATPase n=1 Tax=Kribbella sp. CA-247076 TaxID=3239941 RepID=UPI003D8E041E